MSEGDGSGNQSGQTGGGAADGQTSGPEKSSIEKPVKVADELQAQDNQLRQTENNNLLSKESAQTFQNPQSYEPQFLNKEPDVTMSTGIRSDREDLWTMLDHSRKAAMMALKDEVKTAGELAAAPGNPPAALEAVRSIFDLKEKLDNNLEKIHEEANKESPIAFEEPEITESSAGSYEIKSLRRR